MIHTDRSGNHHFISGMEDSHLVNTLKCFLKPLTEATRNLTQPSATSPIAKALYGKVTDIDANAYANLTTHTLTKIGPYLTEILIRGNEEDVAAIRKDLHAAFGREGKDAEAPNPFRTTRLIRQGVLALPHPDDVEFIDDGWTDPQWDD